ncbi:hypothetical protein D6D01_06660 [Aureobasidium pullulans]|uniref:Uncharacterized protein n=1 Tax=Aureobasidium pullulans TaxID=5580 RepID=A0A4S9KXW9_AURPU|nr:hypothetical protein D6D01_06660 [Aureobasidium pullulans]
MAPDSEMSDAAVPSDAILEKTLRDIVRTAEVKPITIKRVRATAELRLGLDAGFFKNSAEWSTKSKHIIEDEFNEPSHTLSSPGSHLRTANQQPSTSTMASHAPSDIITTLPSEVLGIIVHHCDDGDLGNLRLSCKTLGTAATQPFGRRCLAERRFVFAEYSMQGLVDLTAHPVFSPCVRSLSFGICRLEMPEYGSASTDASRQKLSELVDKNNDFVHSGTHMLMLVQALQNLKAHGNLQVSLGIFEDTNKDLYGEPFYKGYGYDAAYTTFSPRSCEGRNALVAVINATDMSNYLPVGLQIKLNIGADMLPELMEDPVVDEYLTTSSGSLNPRMDVCIDSRGGGDEGRFYVAMKASRLEVVHHSLEDWGNKWTLSETSAYGRFVHALKQTAIVSVIVKDSDTSMSGFSDFLRGWESSLRQLVLSNLQVYKNFDGNHELASALTLFRYIRDNLRLNILEMTRVSIETENGTTEIPILQETISWSGRHKIREGLDFIIAYLVATIQSDSDEEQRNV